MTWRQKFDHLAQTKPYCGICKKSFTVKYMYHSGEVNIDHIKPRYHGGSDSIDNLQLAHIKCNKRKGCQWWKQYK